MLRPTTVTSGAARKGSEATTSMVSVVSRNAIAGVTTTERADGGV